MAQYESVGVRLVVLGLGAAQRQIAAFDSDIKRLGDNMGKLASQSSTMTDRVRAISQGFSALGRTLTVGLTVPIVAAGAAFIRAGSNFEDAFLGVLKTVDDLGDSYTDLTQKGEDVKQNIIDLSLAIPITAVELAKITQIAGQLGVRGVESLDKFTETVARLTVATDFASEEAAFFLARLGNIMGVAADDLGRFASQAGAAIVELGNNFAATEPEIAALALRIAGAGRAVGLTTPQILGFSTALAAAGVKAELGGSAISRILLTMSFAANEFNMAGEGLTARMDEVRKAVGELEQAIREGANIEQLKISFGDILDLEGFEGDLRAVEQGTRSLSSVMEDILTRSLGKVQSDAAEASSQFVAFAKAAGLSTDALAALIKTDPTEAFNLILSGLARMQEEGTLTSDTLKELDLDTIRLKDVINRLGPNLNILESAIEAANLEWEAQNALIEESEKRFTSFSSQMQILKNTLSALAIDIFDLYAKDLQNLNKRLLDVVNYFRKWEGETKKLAVTIAGLVAVVGPLFLVMGNLLNFVIAGSQAWGTFGSAIKAVVGIRFRPFIAALTGVLSVFKSFGGALAGTKVIGLAGALFGSSAKFAGDVKKIVSQGLSKSAAPIGKILQETFAKTGKLGKFIESLFVTPVKSAFNLIIGLVGRTAKTIVAGFNTVTSGLTSIFTNILGSIYPIIGNIGGGIIALITAPLKILGTLLGNVIIPLFEKLGNTALSVFSTVGKAAFGFVGKALPGLFGFLFSGILGIFTKLPLLIAGILAVMIGPDLIKAIVKNWETLLKTLTDSAKQFIQDLKSVGLEKAILLFFSGGSTGSGRTASLYGIAKALGVAEDAAKQFGYTMGEIAATVIYIVKQTFGLARSILTGKQAVDELNKSTTSTTDIILGIAKAVRDFLMGFAKGWTSNFNEIIASVMPLRTAFLNLMTAMKNLFGAIFGNILEGKDKILTPFGTEMASVATKTGQTVGDLLGQFITFAVQALTLVIDIAAKITEGFTNLVAVYQEGGVKAVFDELLVTLAGIWEAIKPDLVALLQPAFDSAVNWLTTTGKSGLIQAISDIAAGIGTVFKQLWEGVDPQKQVGFDVFEKETGKKLGTLTVDQYMQALKDGFVNLPDVYPGPLSTAFLDFQRVNTELPGTGFEGLKSVFQQLFKDIADFIKSDKTKQDIKEAFDDVWGWIKTKVVGPLWEDYLKPALESVLDSVINFIERTVFPIIKAAWRYFLEQALIAAISTITFSPLLAGLSKLGIVDEDDVFTLIFGDNPEELGLGGSLQDYINDEMQKANVTDETKQQFTTEAEFIGSSLMSGLQDGIDAEAQNTYDKVTTAADTIIYTVKDIFGTFSPSTVMYAIGKDLILGLDQGMTSVYGTVLRNVTGFTKRVVSAMQRMVSTISNLLVNTQTRLNTFLNGMVAAIAAAVNAINQILALVGQDPNTTQTLTQSIVSNTQNIINNITNNNFSPTINTTEGTTGMVTDLYSDYLSVNV